eukprot:6608253-Alexandrium_andersonii.AAC.1
MPADHGWPRRVYTIIPHASVHQQLQHTGRPALAPKTYHVCIHTREHTTVLGHARVGDITHHTLLTKI